MRFPLALDRDTFNPSPRTGTQEAAMTIAAILSTKGSEVATVPAGTRVRDAVSLLRDRKIGALPVVDGTRIVGIFSERDLVGCICTHGAEALDLAVDAGMSSPALTVETGTPVLVALSIMTNRRIRHLPVVESGEIRGIISIGDLVKHRIERIEAEAEALRRYIQSA
jgi:CBS domain-containing protein